jgi:hypothetical protein
MKEGIDMIPQTCEINVSKDRLQGWRRSNYKIMPEKIYLPMSKSTRLSDIIAILVRSGNHHFAERRPAVMMQKWGIGYSGNFCNSNPPKVSGIPIT